MIDAVPKKIRAVIECKRTQLTLFVAGEGAFLTLSGFFFCDKSLQKTEFYFKSIRLWSNFITNLF